MRLRRGLFGYRRSDVVAALEHAHDQLAEMAAALERSWRERTELRARAEAAEAALAAQPDLGTAAARLRELVELRAQLVEELVSLRERAA